MAVTAIRLKNFMPFEDTGWIELRSISLLFGANSSGKSAIIRALLLLAQSLDAPEEMGPLVFAVPGKNNLGSFNHLIRGRQFKEYREGGPPGLRQMVFGFRCPIRAAAYEPIVGLVETEEKNTEWDTEFSLSFQWNEADERVELSAITIEIPAPTGFDKRQVVFEALRTEESSAFYLWSYFHELTDEDGNLTLELQANNDLIPRLLPRRSGIIESWSDVSRGIEGIYSQCADEIRRLLNGIYHLGPLRAVPRRYYFTPDVEASKWDKTGLWTIRRLLIQHNPNNISVLERLLEKWVADLELGKRIIIRSHTPSLDVATSVFEILFQSENEADEMLPEVNVCEVGFGASQVLPVLLLALFPVQLTEDALLIIEQPELHLHPNAQVTLTDLFIDQSNARKRFLIETHSEHMLLRIQRRIAETTYETLSPDDEREARNEGYRFSKEGFKLTFVMRGPDGSLTESIQSDDQGKLQFPPVAFQHFFKQDYDEVVELSQTTIDIQGLRSSNKLSVRSRDEEDGN
jgi:hypothetical protein